MAAYESVRPQILGALLDGVSAALRNLATVKLDGLPRMADFALWASAAETAFGWDEGTFYRAYQGNRESANEVALEASPIARPLLEVLEERGSWSGTASELLTALDTDGRLNGHHRLDAVRAHLLELAGDLEGAITHYRRAAGRTTNIPERNYLLTQAARLKDRS